MTMSITTQSVDEMRRILDARAHAARTQVNTSTFEDSLDRLADALAQAEGIIDFGEIPAGVEPTIWQAMEVAFQRGSDTFDSLYRQAWGTPEEETDTWSTFGIDDITPSQRYYPGVDFGTPILQPRPPTTTGSPDVVGSGKVGSALPTTSLPSSSGNGKTSAIEAYRTSQTNQASGQSGLSNISPLMIGGVVAGLVGLYFLVKGK